MKPGECMKEYIDKFFEIVDKLREMEINIPDPLLSILILYSIPEEYESFRIAIETQETLMSPETPMIKLLEEYDARRTVSENNNDAMMVKKYNKDKNQTSGKKTFKYKYYNCGKIGHKANECKSKPNKNNEKTPNNPENVKSVAFHPTRLMSPSTLLRRRRGNSFEMATLLCSMLIGAGFPAVVVSGVAHAHVVENNQRNVPYPHKIIEINIDDDVKGTAKTEQTYRLRPMPDLKSHLNENMTALLKEKAEEEQRIRDEIKRTEQEELELKAVDKYHYRRSHAWVAIIENAPWSIKPKKTYVNESGDITEEPPTVRFIEPSTGLFCESHCKNYILIDSVWNNCQYYVNKQQYLRVSDIRWDLRNNEDWEHLLPGEPYEMRTRAGHSDENVISTDHLLAEEKHLDTVRSWVTRLHIGEKEFEERFPQLQKTILYQRSKHERFSPYTQKDGKVMQLTLYNDNDFQKPSERWEYYENRTDLLLQLKFTYDTSEIEETFDKGRNDSLKFLRSNMNPVAPKELYFFSEPRLDSLKYLKVESDRIVLHYGKRSDFCFYKEFEFKPTGQVLKKIVEKFNRNILLPADKDIAIRTFILSQRKISLRYHYARGALTASTRVFIKPPTPDYGQEVVFDPSLIKSYKANFSECDPTTLELYRIFLAQLQYEDKLIKQFEKILEETNGILDQRKNELEKSCLKFRIFDCLRNKAARIKRLQQCADEEVYQRELKAKPADFLAPYLVAYKNRKLTYEESWTAYNACLFDLKSRFVGLLNDLQRQYEDLTTESKSLQRFLNKFENQFNNNDYEQLVTEAKEIGLNKRMVQQRLTLTHEGSQKKYETVKESLMCDSRLNLHKNK
ncbi:coiled-coil domain-containing protein lobo [Calliphora vicina]|uniref:coiled-coil domain-containing protein lobo n=1 Tax=Calliphora vicina TaxID=7373 RepID=UPI00325C2C68